MHNLCKKTDELLERIPPLNIEFIINLNTEFRKINN